MPEFLMKILPVVLSFCIFITTTYGGESCNCECVLPDYGIKDVCDLLKDGSIKLDNNRHEIDSLSKEMRELSKFKDYFERKMTDDVWTFIKTFTAQSTTEKTTENPNTNINEPLDNLAAEIEMLKKKFAEEQHRLESKIEQTNTNCLSRTDNILEIVNAVEARALQADNVALKRINKTEDQALKMGEEILVHVNNNEIRNLKFEGKISQKVNETKNQIANLSSDIHSKIKDMESETLKLKDELLVQANEQKSQTASAKNEFLVKINDLGNETLKIRRDVLEKIDETSNQIFDLTNSLDSKIKYMESENLKLKSELLVQVNEQKSQTAIAKLELLGKIDNLEKETLKVKDDFQTRKTEIEEQISNAKDEVFARMNETFNSRDLELKTDFFKKVNEIEENSSRQRRELKTHVEQVDDLLRNEMSTQETRWILFEEKTEEMEEILKKLNPKAISSNISNIWYNVSEIQNDATVLWDNITGMHDGVNEMWNNISRIWSRIQPATLKTVAEQEYCGTFLPPLYTIPNNGTKLRKYPGGIFKVVLPVLFQKEIDFSQGYDPGHFHCQCVVISPHWIVIEARCIKDAISRGHPVFYYHYTGDLGVPEGKLKPYLYSENQLCFGCYRNDIGLLKAEGNFSESSCLPTFEMRETLVGWAVFFGPDFIRSNGATLVKVRIISDYICRKSYPSLDSSMLCTAYDEHALRICKEGKGFLFKEIENRTVLIGVAENCGDDGQPIVYTEVAYFSNWIYSFTHSLENEQ